MNDKEKKIFDMQCASTQKLMLAQSLRSPEEDRDYISKIRLTPIAMEAQCVKEDGTVDLNVREISPEDYAFHTQRRLERGSHIEKLRNGVVVFRSPTHDKIERAIDAFMGKFSIETIKEKFKEITNGLFKRDAVADSIASKKKIYED